MRRRRITVGEYVRKNRLLLGILACVVAASAFPRVGIKGGPLRPEYTVTYGAVCVIFFVSGLRLQTESVGRTLRQYKLHAFVQTFAFVLVPLFMQCAAKAFATCGINSWILRGFVTAACMPPPVSTAVILTRAADGNETAALFNSIVGTLLGIVVTPLSLLLNLGFTTIVPLSGTLLQLATTVLTPLLIGLLTRTCTPCKGDAPPLSGLAQCALMLIAFATFCETFHAAEDGLTAGNVLFTVFFVLILQIALLYLAFALANRHRGAFDAFDAGDVIAIVFCSTHKSLALGVPILRTMFHGFSHLAHISLPLLVYHPTQIILGGMLVAQLKEWAERDGRARRRKSLLN